MKAHFADTKHLSNGRRDKRGIGDGCEWHKENAVRKALHKFIRNPRGHARLADPARAGQREKAHALASQPRLDRVDGLAAANERRRFGWQVGRRPDWSQAWEHSPSAPGNE